MCSLKTLAAVTALALVSACASPDAPNSVKADEHASHHPDAAPAAAMPGMQERMKAMREMHDKMMNAKTPAERQALMADHMKSMQDGMEMMKGMGSMGAMGGGMGDGKGMPAEMAKRHQMMEGRMEMMQMMMEMMMQRMPNPPSTK
ncbi:MAG: hypothetical protein HY021_04940 [Burkholderiales bacterium]|nr:hypothetical protein [Burkholderiales bacterium]